MSQSKCLVQYLSDNESNETINDRQQLSCDNMEVKKINENGFRCVLTLLKINKIKDGGIWRKIHTILLSKVNEFITDVIK